MGSPRRTLLRRTVALLTLPAVAGCTGGEEADGGADQDADTDDADEDGTNDGTDDGGDDADQDEESNADDEGDDESDDGPETVTVAVGPNGENAFEPDDLTIDPGTTVVWEWESSGHNVVADDAPDDWEGTGDDTFSEGHTYEHTFETAGEYEYYCSPHQAFGMTGRIAVED